MSRPCRPAVHLLAVALLVLLAGQARAQEAGFQHFITREGDRLMDGAKPWRFIGANMPGLIMPYDYNQRIPERMTLPTAWEQEDGFRSLAQMNARCVRLWNLPIRSSKTPEGSWEYVQGPGRFNDESFKTLDQALALAAKYQVRVIVPLTADWGDYLGGIKTYAEHRGKEKKEFYTDPQLREDFKTTIRHVIERRNSITGQAYRDDKAILAWQFGNEMPKVPQAWKAEMAAYIKSLDSNHLVMDWDHPQLSDTLDPNIDILSRHYYGGDWLKWLDADWAKAQGKRPFVVGEFGLETDMAKVRRFLEEVNGSGVSGALIWSMYMHHRQGGFYWHQFCTHPAIGSYHWAGFSSGDAHRERDLLWTLREFAFRIQGLPVAKPEAPAAPELLPIGEAPLLSWRGSTGATGYDVQRAPAAQGPWTTVGANVSDADTAYRPLFADASATPGRDWFYRVVARNSAGTSSPSNTVGPVRFREAWMVDELKDLGLTVRSNGLKLVNEHNACYAENLYRAAGDRQSWLVYQTPGELRCVKLITWTVAKSADLTLSVSADGQEFKPLDVVPQKIEYAPPPPEAIRYGGKLQTQFDFTATIPAGQRWLRVQWNGPVELDRVELRHTGQD
jgi:hypothetical protein